MNAGIVLALSAAAAVALWLSLLPGPAGADQPVPDRSRDPPVTRSSFGTPAPPATPSPTPETDPRPGPGEEPEHDGSGAEPAYGTYAWPVRGPVIRFFDPPATPYGSGHRGIDIGAPLGAPIQAPADGVVAFAGSVGGALYLSVDHPDGVRTTYSWLSEVTVKRGREVVRGQVIGSTGAGHPGVERPHLHFGARIGDTYIDPMLLLERGSLVGLVHLAPLE